MTACNQNCAQDRVCACRPAVIRTRPGLFARIKRHVRLLHLQSELAGALDDCERTLSRVCALEDAPHENMSDAGRRMAVMRLETERLVLASDRRRVTTIKAEIDHLELGGF